MRRFLLLLAPLAFIFVTFYAPLAIMLVYSFEGFKESLTLSYYRHVLFNATYLKVLAYPAYIALLTTLLTLVLALPAAYYLAFLAPPNVRGVLLMAFNVPMLVNLLLKTYALLSILQPLGLAYSFKGLMVGMVYEYPPC